MNTIALAAGMFGGLGALLLVLYAVENFAVDTPAYWRRVAKVVAAVFVVFGAGIVVGLAGC